MSSLWGGRFSRKMATSMLNFSQSTEADTRLIPYDIWGSQVHALMLARQQIITEMDLGPILTWLGKALTDFQQGQLVLDPAKEDVHMNVEFYLIEGAGA